MVTLQKSLDEVQDTIKSIQNQQVTKDKVLTFIEEMGKFYDGSTEIRKKELANQFIERVEIFPEEQEDGSVIKSVTFKFPLNIGGKLTNMIDLNKPVNGQTTEDSVETVVLLINQNAKAKHHVNAGLDAEDYYKIKDAK